MPREQFRFELAQVNENQLIQIDNAVASVENSVNTLKNTDLTDLANNTSFKYISDTNLKYEELDVLEWLSQTAMNSYNYKDFPNTIYSTINGRLTFAIEHYWDGDYESGVSFWVNIKINGSRKGSTPIALKNTPTTSFVNVTVNAGDTITFEFKFHKTVGGSQNFYCTRRAIYFENSTIQLERIDN